MTDTQRPAALSETQPSGHCPSCGRFVGPYERCPYCGADVGRRIAVRAFKVGSLVLAVTGVAVLLWSAQRSQVPTVQIGQLTGTMNWAYVRIEGVVTRPPAFDPQAGTLSLWVGDDTGQILVSAYGADASWLMDQGQVPVMGDGVALEGTLRIKDEFPYLILNVPQHTQLRPGTAVELLIAQVGADKLYQRVTVSGVIRDDRVPYEGLRILTLRDASGEIDLTLPEAAAALAGPWPELQVGQSLRATGAVDAYRGAPQISIGRAADLIVLDQPVAIAPERRLGELSAVAAGELAAVEGTLVRVQPFSAGIRGTLDDGSGTLTLLLWRDLYEALPDRLALVEGARVRVMGEVVDYQGELEIVPQLPSDVTLLAGAAPATPGRHLGELAAGDLGQRVRVEGVLRSLQPFSAGVRGTLDDGTGTVILLLWQEVYDALPNPTSLQPGTVLGVEGEVTEYQGDLEIVPKAAADVAVLGSLDLPLEGPAQVTPTLTSSSPTTASLPSPSPSPLPPSPRPSPTPPPTPGPRPVPSISAITVDDVGASLSVARAGIAGVEYFSKGVRFTVADGTGRITLLLWQNVLEEIAVRYDLFPGSQVRVSGEIDQYQGDLEIVPRTGEDVVLLRRGERLPLEQRAVSNITPADEGRIFVVEGQVTRIEGAAWLRVWLRDGTGEILIFVPERVVAYLPAGIGAGVRLRVTGEVDIYKGQLEIIPLAGADVEVR